MSWQNITSSFNRSRILAVPIRETSMTILCHTSLLASHLAQVLELRALNTQRDMSVLSTLMTYYSLSIWTRLYRQEFSTCSLELFDFGRGVRVGGPFCRECFDAELDLFGWWWGGRGCGWEGDVLLGFEGFHGRAASWLDDDGGRHCIDGGVD
jgi:hypothetical protein